MKPGDVRLPNGGRSHGLHPLAVRPGRCGGSAAGRWRPVGHARALEHAGHCRALSGHERAERRVGAAGILRWILLVIIMMYHDQCFFLDLVGDVYIDIWTNVSSVVSQFYTQGPGTMMIVDSCAHSPSL